jgi:hypothetical protein
MCCAICPKAGGQRASLLCSAYGQADMPVLYMCLYDWRTCKHVRLSIVLY